MERQEFENFLYLGTSKNLAVLEQGIHPPGTLDQAFELTLGQRITSVRPREPELLMCFRI